MTNTSMGEPANLPTILYSLGGIYLFVGVIPLIQMARTACRRACHASTQNTFFILTAILCFMRVVMFGLLPHSNVEVGFLTPFSFQSHPLFFALSEVPHLLFFSATTVILLFWANIIQRVKINRSLSASTPANLTLRYVVINVVVYLVRCGIWTALLLHPGDKVLLIVDTVCSVTESFLSAVAFLVIGGELFFMLYRVKIATSASRSSKLVEVAGVSSVCTFTFLLRTGAFLFTAFHPKNATGSSTTVEEIVSVGYYVATEVLPLLLLLFMLRQLPKGGRREPPAALATEKTALVPTSPSLQY